MYTAPEMVLMITAGGIVITNTINALRTNGKLDAIKEKTAVIEGHVNSKETKYMEQLASKDNEINILKSVIAAKDRDKALLAQAVASRTRSFDITSEDLSKGSKAIQQEIADNTAETAKAVKDIQK